MGSSLSSLVFLPPETSPHPYMPEYKIPFRENEQLSCFFINNEAELTLLFSHGNAEDLTLCYDFYQRFASKYNVNFFAYDYPGYGQSDGSPGHDGPLDAIEHAYRHLVEDLGLSPTRIVLYGKSIGTCPTTHLAHKISTTPESFVPVAGVILQSPLQSVFRVVIPSFFTLPGDWYPNIDKIKSVQMSPVLIIHGRQDQVIPFEHGEKLFEAVSSNNANAHCLWIDDAHHNNVEHAGGQDYDNTFSGFLEFCLEHELELVEKHNNLLEEKKEENASSPFSSFSFGSSSSSSKNSSLK